VGIHQHYYNLKQGEFSVLPTVSSTATIQYHEAVVYPGIFFGGVQQIQFRTEDRQNGDLGAVAP